MRKHIYFDKLSDDDCIYLKAAFEGADASLEKELFEFIDTIFNQKDIDCFFDKSIGELDGFFEGGILRLLQKIIKLGEPIEFNSKNGINYYKWQHSEHNLSIQDNDILCQIIDKQVYYEQRCLLVTLIKNKYMHPIFVMRDDTTSQYYSTDFERIFFCDNPQNFQDWLDRKRKFEHHTKHDAVKRKNNKDEDVSILYLHPVGDILKIEKLLNEAIAEKSNSSKVLYNYDAENKRYITFYAHRENIALYHAFHLENEKDIPQTIKDKISKIKK